MALISRLRPFDWRAWSVAALGFSIPFSTAAANVLLAVLLLVWLAYPDRLERLRLFWRNPVARLALLLFGILALGCLWSGVPAAERLKSLFKYSDLLLVGLLAGMLPLARQRNLALSGFAAGMLGLLLLSLAIWLGILPEGLFGKIGSGAVVMKLSITHNWLMACFAFGCAMQACFSEPGWVRRGWALLAGVAVLNVLFMVGGRTGYVVLAVLLIYSAHVWKRWRGVCLALLLAGALGAGLLMLPNHLSARVGEAVHDVRHWRPGEGASPLSSQGQRLDWYLASLELVAQRPVLGVGTGGFARAIEKHLAGSAIRPPANPHNEYLLIMVQVGLLGGVALLWLLGGGWQAARGLRSPRERALLRGMVLSMAVGCLFNSFLYDFTEGLLFGWMLGVLGAGWTGGLPERTEGET